MLVEINPDEMELIQCALHTWIANNAKNAEERPELTDTLWADQNVDAQRLLDRLIGVSGHDFCMEGT